MNGVSDERSAVEIARAVRAGRVRAVEVAERALAVAERARSELNAFLAIDREGALAAARRVDDLVAAGDDPGPLAGVPVSVKDNICVAGVRATAGSRILEEFVPPYDATTVARVRAAGAVIVGKTNMDEFGMGSSSERSAFGPVRNPWDVSRVPGGSSGGAAASVAAGVVPLALGTDTGGSVRQPASFCGVLGFKPTYGRLSRYGVIAYASSLDQVGVMTRSAADAALALSVMAGRDERDATSLDGTSGAPEGTPGDVPAGGSLEGVRVGVIEELAGDGNAPEVREALERTVAALRSLGAEVTGVSLPHAPYGVAAYYLVAPAEASSNLARFDGMTYGGRVGESGAGQEAVMRRSRGTLLGPEVRRRVLMGTYALSAGYYDAYYGKALRVRRLVAGDFERAFGRFDVLLSPTAPTPAFRAGERADPLAMYVGDVATVLANLAGLPAVSVPAVGSGDGLPCGVQVLAPPLEDARVLRVAAALESLSGVASVAPGWR